MRLEAAAVSLCLLASLLSICISAQPADVRDSYWKAVRNIAAKQQESEGAGTAGALAADLAEPEDRVGWPRIQQSMNPGGGRKRAWKRRRNDFRCVLHPISCYG
ncbi:hypothetical protein BOX15_Mlig008357g1 [Macrostomum lignano]|nr:hypothetical protein BOX15_Mlig008357g2 [Macrostomum lignano]PAA75712.1 hypothetical protein BOX15_Mlig008357g3 [Macrostomum lignano]PAA90366.1 hypothetical protein BOX15_Mlig008357g1 [Macrostomum lignano]